MTSVFLEDLFSARFRHVLIGLFAMLFVALSLFVTVPQMATADEEDVHDAVFFVSEFDASDLPEDFSSIPVSSHRYSRGMSVSHAVETVGFTSKYEPTGLSGDIILAAPTADQVSQACQNKGIAYDPEKDTVVWYVIKLEDDGWHVDGAIKYGSDEEPEQPTDPDQPTEPEQPTEPGQPTEPEQPTEPNQPTEPEQPDTPKPVTPNKPNASADDDKVTASDDTPKPVRDSADEPEDVPETTVATVVTEPETVEEVVSEPTKTTNDATTELIEPTDEASFDQDSAAAKAILGSAGTAAATLAVAMIGAMMAALARMRSSYLALRAISQLLGGDRR